MLTIVICFPTPALANDAKRHFKEGIRFAENRQWDRAAERLALALAEEPGNVEYQLHFRRALVNASIMLVERGDRLAAQKDYNAAYNAYRQAYSFDPTNEASLVKMRRMLEAQGLSPGDLPVPGDPTKRAANPAARVSMKQVSDAGRAVEASATDGRASPRPARPLARPVKTDVIFQSASLRAVIEQLAQSIHLNVIFDIQSEAVAKTRSVNVELRDVTAAEAIEIILQSNNLAYLPVARRTVIITTDNQQTRMRLEQMAMRTFFIKYADLTELKSAITSMLGTKQITVAKQLNALVVRDTKPNLELIARMIDSMDKSKAEVLIDVGLYEVSRNDLLEIGNQFRASGTTTLPLGLDNLGGIDRRDGVLGKAARTLTGPFGLAVGLPPSTISLFQDRGKARLLASTQVHALDNEQHQIRIGQRVPVKTGSSAIPLLGGQPSGAANNTASVGTIDNIQYENVGLNIDMLPQVYDDEVQVKMKIESSSVDRSTGDLTPSFNQRTMSSVARIKDGQATMIAGVSRTEDSKQIKGIPFVGLIPVLGRFFSTPATSSQQSDVVIIVTPHILRGADITERDHLASDAGRGPDGSEQLSIQQILYRAEAEDDAQSPVAESESQPGGLEVKPLDSQVDRAGPQSKTGSQPPVSGIVRVTAQGTGANRGAAEPAPHIERMQVSRPGEPSEGDVDDDADDNDDEKYPHSFGIPANNPQAVAVTVRAAAGSVSLGQDVCIGIYLDGKARVASSTISLQYDAGLLEVKSVRESGLLRSEPHFTAEGGRLVVTLDSASNGASPLALGQLLLIVFSTRDRGVSILMPGGDTTLTSPDGKAIPLKLRGTTVGIN